MFSDLLLGSLGLLFVLMVRRFQHMQQTEEKVHKHTGYFWLSCTDLISALSCYTFVAVDSMEFLYLSLCFAYLLSLLKKFNSLKIGAGS